MKEQKKLGIYVHIPFCEKKCSYCDFISFRCDEDTKIEYVRRLVDEIKSFRDRYKVSQEDYAVDSIFFGGGTPTTLDANSLTFILHSICEEFKISGNDFENAEISIETNPGISKHGEVYRCLRKSGFNRLSIGLQSVHDSELSALGRIHNFNDFLLDFEKARCEFDNINLDLMFGIPYQTMDSWIESLKLAEKFCVPHLSCYSLQIEEGTDFFSRGVQYMDEDIERSMYHAILDVIGSGYHRYEISNFAREGFRCIHNMKYWKRQDYIGFGLGAHSFVNSIRYANTSDLKKYLNDFEFDFQKDICKEEAMSEYMFLSLRLESGVSEKEFSALFDLDINDAFGEILEKNIKLGLMKKTGKSFSLTNKGIDLSNNVFCGFV